MAQNKHFTDLLVEINGTPIPVLTDGNLSLTRTILGGTTISDTNALVKEPGKYEWSLSGSNQFQQDEDDGTLGEAATLIFQASTTRVKHPCTFTIGNTVFSGLIIVSEFNPINGDQNSLITWDFAAEGSGELTMTNAAPPA